MSEPMQPPAQKPRSPVLIVVNVIVGVVITLITLLTFFLCYTISYPGPPVRGKRYYCANNLKHLWQALQTYAQDNGGRLPYAGSPSDSANKHFALMFPRWLCDEQLFICKGAMRRGYRADNKIDERPSGGVWVETLRPGENCYAYAFGLGGPGTEDSPLACDQFADCRIANQHWASRGMGSNHRGATENVLYMDGHIEFLKATDDGYWPPRRPKMKAMVDGKVCDPANAEPAPDDK